jgi:hypothetical protein
MGPDPPLAWWGDGRTGRDGRGGSKGRQVDRERKGITGAAPSLICRTWFCPGVRMRDSRVAAVIATGCSHSHSKLPGTYRTELPVRRHGWTRAKVVRNGISDVLRRQGETASCAKAREGWPAGPGRPAPGVLAGCGTSWPQNTTGTIERPDAMVPKCRTIGSSCAKLQPWHLTVSLPVLLVSEAPAWLRHFAGRDSATGFSELRVFETDCEIGAELGRRLVPARPECRRPHGRQPQKPSSSAPMGAF